MPACRDKHDVCLQEAAADQTMQPKAAEAFVVAGEREQPVWRPAGAQAQAVVSKSRPLLRGTASGQDLVVKADSSLL